MYELLYLENYSADFSETFRNYCPYPRRGFSFWIEVLAPLGEKLWFFRFLLPHRFLTICLEIFLASLIARDNSSHPSTFKRPSATPLPEIKERKVRKPERKVREIYTSSGMLTESRMLRRVPARVVCRRPELCYTILFFSFFSVNERVEILPRYFKSWTGTESHFLFFFTCCRETSVF